MNHPDWGSRNLFGSYHQSPAVALWSNVRLSNRSCAPAAKDVGRTHETSREDGARRAEDGRAAQKVVRHLWRPPQALSQEVVGALGKYHITVTPHQPGDARGATDVPHSVRESARRKAMRARMTRIDAHGLVVVLHALQQAPFDP